MEWEYSYIEVVQPDSEGVMRRARFFDMPSIPEGDCPMDAGVAENDFIMFLCHGIGMTPQEMSEYLKSFNTAAIRAYGIPRRAY